MTKSELKEKLIKSMDRFNLLPHPTENRIISTTQFRLLSTILNDITEKDLIAHSSAIYTLQAIKNKKIVAGLFRRYPLLPISDELEQHDNYIAIACSFPNYAEDILIYGLTHFCHYANRKPVSFREWLSCFRQPYQMMIFTLCSGPRWTIVSFLTIFGFIGLIHLYLTIIIESHKSKGATSGKLLLWIFDRCEAFKCPILPALWYYRYRMKKMYGPNYTQELFNIYYGNGTGMEDLAKYAEGL